MCPVPSQKPEFRLARTLAGSFLEVSCLLAPISSKKIAWGHCAQRQPRLPIGAPAGAFSFQPAQQNDDEPAQLLVPFRALLLKTPTRDPKSARGSSADFALKTARGAYPL